MTADDQNAVSSPDSSSDASRAAFERMWSRRSLLGRGVGAGLALAVARGASAQTPSSTQHVGAHRPMTPVEPGDLFVLVNRTSQGWTESLWAEATARGYHGYLEWQLDHLNLGDAALDATLTAFPSLAMTSKQIQDTYVVPGMTNVPVAELRKACVLRSILSQRQLFEHMVEFWTDHFNIDQSDGEGQVLKTTDDRDVMRAHARLAVAARPVDPAGLATGASPAAGLGDRQRLHCRASERHGLLEHELGVVDVGDGHGVAA